MSGRAAATRSRRSLAGTLPSRVRPSDDAETLDHLASLGKDFPGRLSSPKRRAVSRGASQVSQYRRPTPLGAAPRVRHAGPRLQAPGLLPRVRAARCLAHVWKCVLAYPPLLLAGRPIEDHGVVRALVAALDNSHSVPTARSSSNLLLTCTAAIMAGRGCANWFPETLGDKAD